IPYIHHDKRGVLKSVSPLNPYVRQQGETIAWEEGIGIGYDNVYSVYVNNVDPGDWIKVREVNFKDGAKTFTARTRGNNPSAAIEVRLDAPNGELLGILNCGSSKDWKDTKCDIKKRDGIHDLYFVFSGDGSDLMDFDSWIFSE
ncbi:MAG: carbohydrate-binding protein, partial [Muribaculaceae bacterium]|nr:carbohydrate-binding protein [Muribaculaceae bacterium]